MGSCSQGGGLYTFELLPELARKFVPGFHCSVTVGMLFHTALEHGQLGHVGSDQKLCCGSLL